MAKVCYYGDKLSTNIAITPEGFLICRNVPIARTGYQHYLESELVEDGDPTKIVYVFRSPKEVFSSATLASFEGKPVTDGHPDTDVTPENYNRLAKGHVQNVRVGGEDDSDKILADLVITDPSLINQIRNYGKRDVSAGYYAEDVVDPQGRVCQTKIRGNHVAVVDQGRAGPTVAIRDSEFHSNKGERTVATKKQIISTVVRYLQDATPKNMTKRMADAAEVLADACLEDADEAMDEDVAMDEDLSDEDFGDEDLSDEDISDEDFGDEDFGDEDFGDEDFGDEDFGDEDISDEDFGDEDMSDEDFGDEDLSDEDISDEELGDEDVVDEDLGDEDVAMDEDLSDGDVIATDTCGESVSDSAIRLISKAANKIRNRADREMVQRAIFKARKKGRVSQTDGLIKMLNANIAKLDSLCGKSLNVDKLQKMYDSLNPHKSNKK